MNDRVHSRIAAITAADAQRGEQNEWFDLTTHMCRLSSATEVIEKSNKLHICVYMSLFK